MFVHLHFKKVVKQIFVKFRVIVYSEQGEIIVGVEFRKSILSSIPVEEVSCASET